MPSNYKAIRRLIHLRYNPRDFPTFPSPGFSKPLQWEQSLAYRGGTSYSDITPAHLFLFPFPFPHSLFSISIIQLSNSTYKGAVRQLLFCLSLVPPRAVLIVANGRVFFSETALYFTVYLEQFLFLFIGQQIFGLFLLPGWCDSMPLYKISSEIKCTVW